MVDNPTTSVENSTTSVITFNKNDINKIKKGIVRVDKQNPTICHL